MKYVILLIFVIDETDSLACRPNLVGDNKWFYFEGVGAHQGLVPETYYTTICLSPTKLSLPKSSFKLY